MKGIRKLISFYPADMRIVELVQAAYNCTFTAAVRMIIRDWGRRLELAEKALAQGKILPDEYKQSVTELTTLTPL